MTPVYRRWLKWRRVPVPPIPTPLEQLGSSPFSFYPPILQIEHNEWIFRCATWDEIEVVNTKTAEVLAVPRRFIGEVSLVSAPVIIVGLVKELEYREGVVYPHVRRVIEMPRAVNDSLRPPMPGLGDSRSQQRTPAMVVGIRVESSSTSRAGRIVRGAIGAVVCVAVAMIFHNATIFGIDAWGARRVRSAAATPVIPFTAKDDYPSIVKRLGEPRRDQWMPGRNGAGYRRLWYPRMVIILSGSDREHAHYAGAIGRDGRVIHSIGSAAELLAHLK